MVQRPGVPGLPDRGLEDPRLPHARAGAGRRQPRRDRAHPGPAAHRRPHRPPGHRHRPPRRRGRPPPHQAGRDHQEPQGPAQHPRDKAAGAGRRPDRPGDRRPVAGPGQFPPGHEAGRADGAEGRSPRDPSPVRGPPGRLGDVPPGVLPRGPGPAAHAAGRHRLRLPRGPDHLRAHRRQGLDLQGRHPALQGLGRGQDHPGGGHGGRRDLGPGPAPPGHLRRWRPSPPRPGRARNCAHPGRSRRRRRRAKKLPRPGPSSLSTPSSSACWRKKKRSSAAPAASITKPPISPRTRSRC